MTYQGAPILAYYHSCCGGHTDSAFEIKGKDLPYLKGVECPWCVDCPKFRWNFDLNAQRLAERVSRAGYLIRSVDSLLPVRTTASGRVYELEITSPDKSFFLSGEDLREALGQQELKSTRFQVSRRNKTFHFSGTGYGHGIGACQWGMKGMAEKGHNWRQILKYYYSGVEFVKIEQR
jgi:stage II sporulation protein D